MGVLFRQTDLFAYRSGDGRGRYTGEQKDSGGIPPFYRELFRLCHSGDGIADFLRSLCSLHG